MKKTEVINAFLSDLKIAAGKDPSKLEDLSTFYEEDFPTATKILGYAEEQSMLSCGFCNEDVVAQARIDGYTLDDKQLKNIVGLIERRADASIGVNWDFISWAIDEVINPS